MIDIIGAVVKKCLWIIATAAVFAGDAVASDLDLVHIHPRIVENADIKEWLNDRQPPAIAEFDSLTSEVQRVRLPYGVEGVTVIARGGFHTEKIGFVDLNGMDSVDELRKSNVLVSGATGTMNNSVGRKSVVIVLSLRLQPGQNTLRLGASSLFGTNVYRFDMAVPDKPSSDTSLTTLALADAVLDSPFMVGRRNYSTFVVGHSLEVNAMARAGSTVKLYGFAPNGEPLPLAGNQVQQLAPGTNTIRIEVTAEDGTTVGSYTLLANVSDHQRKVRAGDNLIKSESCDKGVCEATLNGVRGLLACRGSGIDGFEYENDGVKLSIGSIGSVCNLWMQKSGVVDSVSGYMFASFQEAIPESQ